MDTKGGNGQTEWKEAGRERADRMEGWREEGTEGESE